LRCAVVGYVVIAELGANGAGFGSVNFKPGAKIQRKVEGTGLRNGNLLGGIHVTAVAFKESLRFVAGKEIPLHADWEMASPRVQRRPEQVKVSAPEKVVPSLVKE
jgi:hypothetical protein